jgi:hypothetical protein
MQQEPEVMRDPPQRALQRVSGQNSRSGLDEGFQRGTPSGLEGRSDGHALLIGRRRSNLDAYTARFPPE